jgi:acetyl esterase
MPLDPQARAFLDEMAANDGPPLHELPVEQVRQIILEMTATKGEPEAVGTLSNRTIPGPGGDIPIRIYLPHGTGPFPVLTFFHGGGWVAGNLDTHDATCRTLTNAAGCALVSVDYRLAPEHKFPAAVEDCYAAVTWIAAHAAAFGGDPARLAVGGDSAGGNLAAVVSHMARDNAGPRLAFQLLIYPATDCRFDTQSYRDNAEGYLLTKDSMEWFWTHYLRSDADAMSPQASPLRASQLHDLPPALVITAEFDPLRDEGEAYGARLRTAGVPTVVTRYDGMIHTFFGMGAVFDRARDAVAEAAAGLRKAFDA